MKERIKYWLRRLTVLRRLYYRIQFRLIRGRIPRRVLHINDRNLNALQGIHAGQRCFIIGNGPSLTLEDLHAVSGEVTFGCNKIYKLYDRTPWRPTYYCMQDDISFGQTRQALSGIISQSKLGFVSMNAYRDFPADLRDNTRLRIMYMRYRDPVHGRVYPFSQDISHEIYEGLTVTYSMIQIAVYMGFTRIYLLGVDHSYSLEIDADGRVVRQNPGQRDHFYESKPMPGQFHPSKVMEMARAFLAAREYADAHGIAICNATRGGRLETFLRISLEEAAKDDT